MPSTVASLSAMWTLRLRSAGLAAKSGSLTTFRDRFSQLMISASDLAFALEALSDSGVSNGGTEVTQPRSNSHWIVAGVVCAAVALLDAGLVFYRLQNSGGSSPESPEWVRLTNLIDSATAPALSPDGRMLAFIRGPDPFVSKGEIYLKLLPEGAPVQPTHADTMKMSPVFSPDGSQIAYTVSGHWDTWIVPTLGERHV
jgi:hypothetical protein